MYQPQPPPPHQQGRVTQQVTYTTTNASSTDYMEGKKKFHLFPRLSRKSRAPPPPPNVYVQNPPVYVVTQQQQQPRVTQQTYVANPHGYPQTQQTVYHAAPQQTVQSVQYSQPQVVYSHDYHPEIDNFYFTKYLYSNYSCGCGEVKGSEVDVLVEMGEVMKIVMIRSSNDTEHVKTMV
ncbi:hypothetical protein DFA_11504 [Cavenderia fasciculata]|uniref:Uncharacterized protein n=1 Tax=Cavenderia fasciculata TaxID=261658 RepID=F4QDB5_CACFS|nr:uncharacterized protein DFA_11504 [Cavenderia fasciculata]EGG13743.1 hypothetical protein DFA_11504 [Cavenderia fasciculata]|eukprot:XP_004350447.1 hypothetical protein DFA_11504 [Cavenderia fasciculata]